jgi:predicted negative regulator of RcsB-dependent stress response
VESYRTEEEQVEALRRWWEENGKSTIAAIVVALLAGFGWQGWQGYQDTQREKASDLYQTLLQSMSAVEPSSTSSAEITDVAQRLKTEHGGTTYAQFAALHLARMAVASDKLDIAEEQLRWVLTAADSGSDVALITQQRLARVLAARGDTEQALSILAQGTNTAYAASYAAARGDILLASGNDEEARAAYLEARSLADANSGQLNLSMLEQKLESLSPVEPRTISVPLNTDDQTMPAGEEG